MASAISKTGNMGEEQQTVYLVDDNLDILASLSMLLEHAGFRVRSFASPQAFLDALSAEATGCLVLDLQMPEMNGLQVQEAVHARCPDLPVVFLTGHGDVLSRSWSMTSLGLVAIARARASAVSRKQGSCHCP